MTGTPSQIERAEQIKRRVDAEFDRVAHALEGSARRQSAEDRIDTVAIVAIVQEKHAEVMAKDEAVYFIRDWQEPCDQARQILGRDPAYRAIKMKREARERAELSYLRNERDRMIRIHVTLTAKEISLLSSLASDQLFHREFIDTRLPGYKSNRVDLSLGKALVVRLRTLLDRAAGTSSVRTAG